LLLGTNVRPDDLSIREIIRLAGHEILSVREASWKMCRESVPRLRAEMEQAVRLLDVRWEDSRAFARELLRESFGPEDWTPQRLVGVCDSVRSDVQRFGRELITRFFREEDGQEYLLRLSEHPSESLQLFVTNYLERYAADNVERLAGLEPYFLSVLSRVNKARIAKLRVLQFLEREALKSEPAARVVAEILARQSATCVKRDRAACLQAMVRIRGAFPAIPLPIRERPVEVRSGV